MSKDWDRLRTSIPLKNMHILILKLRLRRSLASHVILSF